MAVSVQCFKTTACYGKRETPGLDNFRQWSSSTQLV